MSKISTRSSRRGKTTTPAITEITTYPNATRYLLGRNNVERLRSVSVDTSCFKLDRIKQIMEKLGNPQNEIRYVHVAGTVGKGSIVAMIASILRNCGYAVGEFTSPHLVDVRERVQINGQMISKAEFTEQLKEVAEAASSLTFEPTFFELLTALSFKHFAEQAVDIAVIETGLGGRLDCTNIITPEVSIITKIDFDHTHLLGKTLVEIAAEKAGIIKPGVPVISLHQEEEVDKVLREVAEKLSAPISVINKEIEFSYRFGASADREPHSQVCVFTATSRYEHIPAPLPGEHQAFNCGLVLAAVDILKNSGYDLPEQKLYQGLEATTLPGRMEIIWDNPRILIDGAHNPVAITALIKAVGAHIPYDSMVCVFGCCEDKDVPTLLDRLALGGDKVIFTKAKNIPRAMDPVELQQIFTERSGKMSQVAKDISEALNIATRAVGREDIICVTGSFYLAGETKKYLADLAKKRTAEAASRQ